MIKVVVLVVLVVFCNLLNSSTGDSVNVVDKIPDVVNNGALFSFNSTIGKVTKIAIESAVEDVNSNSNVLGGYCIDVFTAALNFLPYGVPYKLIGFRDGQNNPKVDDLLHLITTDYYDAAVGDFVITTGRTKLVDFTQPYIDSGLVVKL